VVVSIRNSTVCAIVRTALQRRASARATTRAAATPASTAARRDARGAVQQRRREPGQHRADAGHRRRRVLRAVQPPRQQRHAVHQDPAADQEHGRGAQHRQHFHHARRDPQQAAAQRAPGPSRQPGRGVAQQQHAGVVELHDRRHETVDARGHRRRHRRHDRRLVREGGRLYRAQRDHDDLGGEDEIGANRAAYLVLLEGDHVDVGIEQRVLQRLLGGRVVVRAVQEAVRELLEALVAEIGAADHQHRRHQPGHERADGQRGRHQDQLVARRALRDRPHHRQLALGAHARDLLRVQREIVAEDPGGLFRGELGHHRHIVEHRRDVVEQREQAGPCHVGSPFPAVAAAVTTGSRPKQA